MTGPALAALNVKVLFICAAAGLAIGTDALGVAGTVPAYDGAGERLDAPLGRPKIVLIGLAVLYKGIHALWPAGQLQA